MKKKITHLKILSLSTAVLLALAPSRVLAQSYCEPSVTWAGSNNWIADVETTAGISNISNPTGAGEYTDYSATDEVSALKGYSINFSISASPTGSNCYSRIWVDWNKDGDFGDSGELVFDYTTGDGTKNFSGSISVPLTATVGTTRMRVRTDWYGSTLFGYPNIEPCNETGYGEIEDYAFTVINPEPCSSVTAGIASGPDSVCSAIPFSVMATGATMATGLVSQWQKSSSATGPWMATGATGSSYYEATGITTASYYRYYSTCTASGSTDTSDIVAVTIKPVIDCYCTPSYTYGCDDGDDIKDMVLAGASITLSNLGTGCPGSGYADYTADTSLGIPDLTQGLTFSGNVTTTSFWGGDDVRIWIDYNDNGFFEGSESAALLEDLDAGSDGVFSLTVPIDAPVGNHRMRVRMVAYTTASSIDPCTTENTGECNDYMVSVIAPTPCSEVTFPEVAHAVSNPPNVCGTGNVVLKLDTLMPSAAGVTYQWKSAATETGTYTNVGTPLTYSPDKEITGLSTSTYYKCDVLCEGTPVLTSTAVYVQSVSLDDVVLTTSDSQKCGAGVVTLTGSVTEGSVFWYENAEGGSPVAMGNSFETPFLTATDTFYATGGAFPAVDAQVGTGTSFSPDGSTGPFNICYRKAALQFMYTADQIHAAGGGAGLMQSIAFEMGTLPDYALPNYTVSIKFTAAAPPLTWQTTGFTDIYTAASFLPGAAGWITFPLGSGMDWNGTDNIIVKVCWSQVMPTYSCEGGTHRYSNISGQMLYYRNDGEGSACGETGTNTSNYLPNVLIKIKGCETERQPVIAYIRPVPDPIDIGPSDTVCKDLENGLTLDAGEYPTGYTFLWDNGSTEQTRRITESGTYYVAVANEFGCKVYDTVEKTLLNIPIVELGNDTSICEGGNLTLNAGTDGSSYYWSTGAETDTIEVITSGSYNVLVTNAEGCIATDTINVTVSGMMPSIASIIVSSEGAYTFSFEPSMPENITGYHWDFGDGATSTDENPIHTYTATGDYTVTLTVYSECGEVTYTTSVHILGIDDLSTGEHTLSLYPNPAKDLIIVENKGNQPIKSIVITDALGHIVLEAEHVNSHKYKLELSRFASGIYTARIITGTQSVIRKFDVIK